MKSPEIESAVKNIEFYAGKIRELAKKQYDLYFEQYDLHNPEGMKLVNSLAEVGAATARIEIQCHNMKTNLAQLV